MEDGVIAKTCKKRQPTDNERTTNSKELQNSNKNETCSYHCFTVPYIVCLQDQSFHYCLNDVRMMYTVCKIGRHICKMYAVKYQSHQYDTM